VAKVAAGRDSLSPKARPTGQNQAGAMLLPPLSAKGGSRLKRELSPALAPAAAERQAQLALTISACFKMAARVRSVRRFKFFSCIPMRWLRARYGWWRIKKSQ